MVQFEGSHPLVTMREREITRTKGFVTGGPNRSVSGLLRLESSSLRIIFKRR